MPNGHNESHAPPLGTGEEKRTCLSGRCEHEIRWCPEGMETVAGVCKMVIFHHLLVTMWDNFLTRGQTWLSC